MSCNEQINTLTYLKLIGVLNLPPLTSPFDPGYDPATLESHLEQSSHLMSILKISMACWMVANETATRRKVAAAPATRCRQSPAAVRSKSPSRRAA